MRPLGDRPLDGDILPAGKSVTPYDSTYHPTLEQRELIRDLALYGLPYRRMCTHIINPADGEPISVPQLCEAFKEELREGNRRFNLEIPKTAYRVAMGWPAEYDMDGNLIRKELQPQTAMLLWYMKQRLAEQEEQPAETAIEMNVRAKVSALSYEDRVTIRDMLQKKMAGQPKWDPKTHKRVLVPGKLREPKE